ncbi:hypothetical protein N7495_007403 [Penicillium taxi]|uniref:uncharacterized protein n=1 Tax=Penicillium taxi TaxID=168475 RepID=UPI0025450FC6|nr:uncharacterized protein N7495_007403 [Penicillium taxi]KAJ5887362.1 hypothetical protein N7495_007403 [Penicillium taxi]
MVRYFMCIDRLCGHERRHLIIHLLCVSGLIVVLNILLLLTEYKLHFIQHQVETGIHAALSSLFTDAFRSSGVLTRPKATLLVNK